MNTWSKWSITNGIIVLCVLIFIAMTFAGGSEQVSVLLSFGAMQNQFVQHGEVWRLITANFLHIGIFHLLMNMVIYYQFGNLLESVLKRWQYVIVIVCAMVMTTTVSYFFADNYAVSAGWSGVLFGIMGAFIVLSLFFPQRFQHYAKNIIIPILVINVIIGFLNSGVNWIGHFGGFVGGFISMFFIAAVIRNKK